jgi:hypothetical protein
MLLIAALWSAASGRPDQPSYDTVGAIEGDAISVQGPLNIEVVQGRTRTILRSGSDIHVNSGRARIDLIEGGEISICGPAHLSVLKSVNLLTLALDSGVIHARLERQPALTVFTAQLQVKPFAIGDAPPDTLVGFDPTGAMCIRADSGAVRIEQQLGTQSIVVPQAGEVLITNGQIETLRSGVTHCACELQMVKTRIPRAPPVEVSQLATPQEIEKSKTEPTTSRDAAKPAANDDPVYQVYMPPLSYDASAKVQRDNFDPQFIVLVRRARVRPSLIFQGSVKNAPAIAQRPPLEKTPEMPAHQNQQAQQNNPQSNNSIITRIRAFFRNLFT